MNKTQKLAYLALGASAALVLSYFEALLPPIYAAFPGIKMGLPNIVIIFILYRLGFKEAVTVSFVRLICVTLLFGNLMMLAFSALGAAFSLAVMYLLKRTSWFSTVGVSVAGGVAHNLGQIIVAMLLLETSAVGFYFPVLLITGCIAGVIVGIAGSLVLKVIKK